MERKNFDGLLTEGRRSFSIEQNSILQEEAIQQLGEDLSSEEVINQKVRLEKEIELPERYHLVRRIKQKLKESRKIIENDKYNVDIDSDIAKQIADQLQEDESRIDDEELESLKKALEKFIVENKDIESPELD